MNLTNNMMNEKARWKRVHIVWVHLNKLQTIKTNLCVESQDHITRQRSNDWVEGRTAYEIQRVFFNLGCVTLVCLPC